jgi:RNase P subunit RPR2
MPLAYAAKLHLRSIERPLCSKCHGRMMLGRIEVGPANSELRTFECPKCGHVQRVLETR